MWPLLLLSLVGFSAAAAPPENSVAEQRCRCICPSLRDTVFQEYANISEVKDPELDRRLYINASAPDKCTAEDIILSYWVFQSQKYMPLKVNASSKTEESLERNPKISAFLSKCSLKFETRNVAMLKVVVGLVICAVLILVLYMAFLLCLDPVLRRSGAGAQSRYQQQVDEDENIFARDEAGPSAAADPAGLRARSVTGGVLDKVEAEQSKWRRKVEAQRKGVFDDHTMLN